MQYLYVTKAEDKSYCHVFLYPTEKGGSALWLDNGRLESLDAFRIALPVPDGAKLTA